MFAVAAPFKRIFLPRQDFFEKEAAMVNAVAKFCHDDAIEKLCNPRRKAAIEAGKVELGSNALYVEGLVHDLAEKTFALPNSKIPAIPNPLKDKIRGSLRDMAMLNPDNEIVTAAQRRELFESNPDADLGFYRDGLKSKGIRNFKEDLQEAVRKLRTPESKELKDTLRSIYLAADRSGLFTAIENYYGKEQIAARA